MEDFRREMNCEENEKAPIEFTQLFDRIICPYCNYQFVLIAAFRTLDEERAENDDYSKWFITQQCTCNYCPTCGNRIAKKGEG